MLTALTWCPAITVALCSGGHGSARAWLPSLGRDLGFSWHLGRSAQLMNSPFWIVSEEAQGTKDSKECGIGVELSLNSF